jgi:hypothetical protein
MTDRLALTLALILAVALGADFYWQGGQGSLSLAQKSMKLLDWVVFWR